MIEPTTKLFLCAQLEQLLAANVLIGAPQKTGARLLHRLKTDISVVLAGPEDAAKEYLHETLANSGLPRTSLRILPWTDPPDLETADVCIWCTVGFETREAAQWQHTPDRLKDHSFLVVFSQINPTLPPLGPGALDRLADIAAEEFYCLSHVAFGNSATKAQPHAIATLVGEVTKIVGMGLAADADNAEMFLKTHMRKIPVEQRVLPAAPPQPARPQLSPASQNVGRTAVLADRTTARGVYSAALETMCDHLIGLGPFLHASKEAEFQEVLAICEETATAVAQVLTDGDLRDPEGSVLTQEALCAADTIMLMSLEGGVTPTISAVATMLQLRRELELQCV